MDRQREKKIAIAGFGVQVWLKTTANEVVLMAMMIPLMIPSFRVENLKKIQLCRT
jgi:hypothetical protein